MVAVGLDCCHVQSGRFGISNGRSIGRIQIFDAHSLVDLPQGMPEDVFQGLRRLKVMNRELQISRSRD